MVVSFGSPPEEEPLEANRHRLESAVLLELEAFELCATRVGIISLTWSATEEIAEEVVDTFDFLEGLPRAKGSAKVGPTFVIPFMISLVIGETPIGSFSCRTNTFHHTKTCQKLDLSHSTVKFLSLHLLLLRFGLSSIGRSVVQWVAAKGLLNASNRPCSPFFSKPFAFSLPPQCPNFDSKDQMTEDLYKK